MEYYEEKNTKIILAGNPNVGKSTVFNALTGLKQHTGNWTGKTVDLACGNAICGNTTHRIIDLPGLYSLFSQSAEERVAGEFITASPDCTVVVVVSATQLERGLVLAMQIREANCKTVLAINLIDEAARLGIHIDTKKLEALCGIKTVALCAVQKGDCKKIISAAESVADCVSLPVLWEQTDQGRLRFSKSISTAVTIGTKKQPSYKLDKILTSKSLGIPIMLLLLSAVFFITITLANYPSQFLAFSLGALNKLLAQLLSLCRIPALLKSFLIDGVFSTVFWVVAVMLPPMAIFFPLFTFLEDLGYLPRVAFNLDKPFSKCGSCGKQALCMCMGFGCNAAAVVGSRIIPSRRRRLAAIVTNSFVPCNGRFPTLFIIGSILISSISQNPLIGALIGALSFVFMLVLSVLTTFFVTALINRADSKSQSVFALELPPFRRPRLAKILVHSLFDRTLKILWRAVAVSAIAGAVIWGLSSICINDKSLFSLLCGFLDGFAQLIGLDGVILTAFTLGFPANEIVLPLAVMGYNGGGLMAEISDSALKTLLINNGWNTLRAINTLIFCLFHFPCSTTMLTIKKETNSALWTAAAFFIPLAIGIILCLITTAVYSVFF